jgi:hypothetical protein
LSRGARFDALSHRSIAQFWVLFEERISRFGPVFRLSDSISCNIDRLRSSVAAGSEEEFESFLGVAPILLHWVGLGLEGVGLVELGLLIRLRLLVLLLFWFLWEREGAMASMDAACEAEGVERCPFLRNIGLSTSFAFSKLKFPAPAVPAATTKAGRGPIFEDGPGFESSFRLFHGKDGVVPLKQASPSSENETEKKPKLSFHPLSASAATISLSSAFGPAGPFGFDGFMENFITKKKPTKKKKQNKDQQQPQPEQEQKSNFEAHMHEAMGSDWLATGQCPIAKSFRAMSGALPLVSKMLKLPKGMKYRCPPAIVAARAALAKTSAVKKLRPQALPTKVMAIGMLGMALNVPLGVWREHTKKFSPQWFLAVHATIPFIAMLRKAVVMPKYAIAFTIGSAVLGQAVGARAERLRLANLKASIEASQQSITAPIQQEIELPTLLHHSSSSLVEPVEVQKRLTNAQLQCGSEALVSCSSSSSSSSPVLIH